jgi:hypothetical protein
LKKIKVEGHIFTIKELVPLDFLSNENNVPPYYFQVEKVKTMFEKVKEAANDKQDDADVAGIIEFMKLILDKGVVDFNGGTFYSYKLLGDLSNMAICNEVVQEILDISHSKFKKIFNVNKEQIRLFDLMGQRYGRLPIECLCPNGGYSELDAFMFNEFVLINAWNQEQTNIKRQNKKNGKH